VIGWPTVIFSIGAGVPVSCLWITVAAPDWMANESVPDFTQETTAPGWVCIEIDEPGAHSERKT
jgi:hypothetical protein